MCKVRLFYILAVLALCQGCSADRCNNAMSELSKELCGAPNWIFIGCDGRYGPVCGVGSSSRPAAPNQSTDMATKRATQELRKNISRRAYWSITWGGQLCPPDDHGGFGQTAPHECEVLATAQAARLARTLLAGRLLYTQWTSQTGTIWIRMEVPTDVWRSVAP
jgi:hypothetical protein